jgi:hypothetical protein
MSTNKILHLALNILNKSCTLHETLISQDLQRLHSGGMLEDVQLLGLWKKNYVYKFITNFADIRNV